MNFQTFKPLLGYLKNKYLLATLAFLVWMIFFDPKDFGIMYARSSKLQELKTSEKHLIEKIKETKQELSLLKTDASSIEKYAREKFYMKKDNEDLFLTNK